MIIFLFITLKVSYSEFIFPTQPYQLNELKWNNCLNQSQKIISFYQMLYYYPIQNAICQGVIPQELQNLNGNYNITFLFIAPLASDLIVNINCGEDQSLTFNVQQQNLINGALSYYQYLTSCSMNVTIKSQYPESRNKFATFLIEKIDQNIIGSVYNVKIEIPSTINCPILHYIQNKDNGFDTIIVSLPKIVAYTSSIFLLNLEDWKIEMIYDNLKEQLNIKMKSFQEEYNLDFVTQILIKINIQQAGGGSYVRQKSLYQVNQKDELNQTVKTFNSFSKTTKTVLSSLASVQYKQDQLSLKIHPFGYEKYCLGQNQSFQIYSLYISVNKLIIIPQFKEIEQFINCTFIIKLSSLQEGDYRVKYQIKIPNTEFYYENITMFYYNPFEIIPLIEEENIYIMLLVSLVSFLLGFCLPCFLQGCCCLNSWRKYLIFDHILYVDGE